MQKEGWMNEHDQQKALEPPLKKKEEAKLPPKPQNPPQKQLEKKPSEKEEIPEQLLDISDGDYLLESLRDFRPPSSNDRTKKGKEKRLSIFDPGHKDLGGLQFIGGDREPAARGQDSFEELKFFDRPDL